MIPKQKGVYLLILATFFLSGVAGLLYQVVWTRYLALFLGHTSYAVVAVLAAFMGGLAIGNAWLGSRVDRIRRPLFFYAALEAGIGIYAVLFPKYYGWVHDAFLAVVSGLRPEGGLRLALQFLFAGVTILFPTILMGATLPALTKFVTRSLGELRGKVAALYAINSSGAVVGVLLADWWWIPSLGLEMVVYLGASISLGIALVTYVLSVRGGEPKESASPAADPDEERFTPLELKAALVAAGVSGFVAMLYEVAWTRLLALALGSSTHAYSLMLATFITGIAVGGWVVSLWRRGWNTLAAFAVAELALAGTLFASMWFYDLLPYWFARSADLLSRKADAYPLYELLQALVCFSVMFVPAVCLGMTLPLVSRVATQELARTGRSVGRVFAVNTVGTVLGSVLTGLVLLPYLGLATTFALGIGLNALIGVVVLAARRGKVAKALLGGLVATALWTVLAHAVLGERWSRAFNMGLWRDVRPPTSVESFRERAALFELRYFRDGAGSTVSVLGIDDPVAKRTDLSLKVNGKSDASSGDDMTTQILAGQIPMLLRPSSRNVLVVGAGSGVTVGSILRHGSVTNVDLVEISPEVVVAARDHFGPFNHDALKDPRCHTFIEDAKSFLKTTSEKYDLIVTEPSNPWMAGVAAVFSREYYEDCLARLATGGLVAQWVQIYETDDALFETVVATFGSVFPHTSLWQTSSGDLLLVGAPNPFEVDLGALAARMRETTVAEDLKRIEVTRPVNILTLQMAGIGDAFFLAPGETRIHSDFHPVLEYRAQRAFFARGIAGLPGRIDEAQRPRPRSLLGEHLRANPLTTNDCLALARQYGKSGMPHLAVFRSVLHRWRQLDPSDPMPLRLLSSYSIQNPAADGDASRLAADPFYLDDERLTDLRMLRQYADLMVVRHRTQRSAFHVPRSERLEQVLGALVRLDADNQRVHRLRLAEVLWDRGQDDRARRLFTEALDPKESVFGPLDFRKDPGVVPHMVARLLDAELRAKRLDKAMEFVGIGRRLEALMPEFRVVDPYLAMLIRRTEVTVEASRPAVAQPASFR